MNPAFVSPTIPLQRGAVLRLADAVGERAATLLRRLRSGRDRRAAWRRAVRAERELADLSPQTLRDIGAPQGLLGQRRWQEEQEAAQVARLLDLHGW
jgi:uncharacterized protein YjiS (DUF1127 family)